MRLQTDFIFYLFNIAGSGAPQCYIGNAQDSEGEEGQASGKACTHPTCLQCWLQTCFIFELAFQTYFNFIPFPISRQLTHPSSAASSQKSAGGNKKRKAPAAPRAATLQVCG